MREGIGSIFLYNIILIFLVIVFAFLAGTVSYSKAFKVNSRIVKSIEIFEGYNGLTDEEILRTLSTIGYNKSTDKCPNKDGQVALQRLSRSGMYDYCIYKFTVKNRYSAYGVISYMYLDLPFVKSAFKLPIYAKTEKIFKFNT